jgi:hypothetical protein
MKKDARLKRQGTKKTFDKKEAPLKHQGDHKTFNEKESFQDLHSRRTKNETRLSHHQRHTP